METLCLAELISASSSNDALVMPFLILGQWGRFRCTDSRSCPSVRVMALAADFDTIPIQWLPRCLKASPLTVR